MAAEYAAGEGTADGEMGSGYVQKYRVDRPRLFDFEKNKAWESGAEFERPSKGFVDSLVEAGYTGIRHRTLGDICLFSARGLQLVARWRVTYDPERDRFIYTVAQKAD